VLMLVATEPMVIMGTMPRRHPQGRCSMREGDAPCYINHLER